MPLEKVFVKEERTRQTEGGRKKTICPIMFCRKDFGSQTLLYVKVQLYQ